MGKLSLAVGVPRGNQAIWNKVSDVVKTLPWDYQVISWNRPGSRVAGSGSVSLHASGNALDIRRKGGTLEGSSPCGDTQLDPESMKAGDALYKAAGNRFDENLWKTCTGGNHYNHNHIGDEDAGAVSLRGLGVPVGVRDSGATGGGSILQQVTGYGVAILVIVIGLVLVALFIAFKAYTAIK